MDKKYENELIELKKKHQKVITLTVPLDEDDSSNIAILFLKKPDRTVRALVGSLATSKDGGIRAIEAALKNLYIGGEELKVVLENDDAMASLDEAIYELFAVQKATIKKN